MFSTAKNAWNEELDLGSDILKTNCGAMLMPF